MSFAFIFFAVATTAVFTVAAYKVGVSWERAHGPSSKKHSEGYIAGRYEAQAVARERGRKEGWASGYDEGRKKGLQESGIDWRLGYGDGIKKLEYKIKEIAAELLAEYEPEAGDE